MKVCECNVLGWLAGTFLSKQSFKTLNIGIIRTPSLLLKPGDAQMCGWTCFPTAVLHMRKLDCLCTQVSLVSWPNGFSNSFATSLRHQMLSKRRKERIGPATGDRVKTITYLGSRVYPWNLIAWLSRQYALPTPASNDNAQKARALRPGAPE